MKKIISLIAILLSVSLAYALPPTPPASAPTSTQILSVFTGAGDYLKSDGTKGTPDGSGDVVGPATSTQYKIPLWGAADKTLVDGVAVGTAGMLLRSAGAGANPAWSAYTLALPGEVGAVLYSDGTNWTRSTAPSLLALTLYGQSEGAGAQLALGSSSGSTDPNNGKMLFRNATNANTFTITSGASGAAIGWTLPTAAPGGANYLLNVDADGTMGYTDPASLGGSDRFNAVFDGGGSEIADNKKVYVYVPFDCTIVGAYAMADQSGSIVVDVWKDTMANYAPTDADTITASAPVTITTATNSSDTTLTGWTTTLSAGDVLAFSVDSCTTITWANITLKVVRR